MKRYQNIAVNIVEFIDTVADAIGEQLIENRFIQLMSIYKIGRASCRERV